MLTFVISLLSDIEQLVSSYQLRRVLYLLFDKKLGGGRGGGGGGGGAL